MDAIQTMDGGEKIVLSSYSSQWYNFDELSMVEQESDCLKATFCEGQVLYTNDATIEDFIRELKNDKVYFGINKNRTKIIVYF